MRTRTVALVLALMCPVTLAACPQFLSDFEVVGGDVGSVRDAASDGAPGAEGGEEGASADVYVGDAQSAEAGDSMAADADASEGASADASPEGDAGDGFDGFVCTPLTPSMQSFSCPLGGGPVQLETPTYYGMSNAPGNTMCGYDHTPTACLCAETYNCACLKTANVCATASYPTGQWVSCSAEGSFFFVTCQ